ncbi:alpha-glucuronidase family glycosyl hydrolase [Lachnoclostridium sp.]|uniref:alpha-glucuronidase family glycosyl hydrolase n=1 Tax=Lachnoclostridium sp. TaxID=2028282 RepID=UPI002897094E|nr:alpha-glucuronidase family glycosyl hydrolase [Lachnoclostridium sp.]
MGFEKAWLNYCKSDNLSMQDYFMFVTYNKEDSIVKSTVLELTAAAKGLFSIDMKSSLCDMKYEVDSTKKGIHLQIGDDKELENEGYRISLVDEVILIEAFTSRGILYGTFDLIRSTILRTDDHSLNKTIFPKNPLRMLNHWDNMDGSIERGYSGNSFFFEHGEVIVNERTKAYARLVSSVGINAVVINNVNVRGIATNLITNRYIDKLKQIGEIFASYGIKLFLSLNFAAPMELGGLTTADPLDEAVRLWWKEAVKLLFIEIPSFGGFLVKADSEGRPGPFTYQRTHAEGANMLAEVVKPYGGLIIWRCFVYNCKQDWRDTKTDRARASFDNFQSLDGSFAENVILQVKNGPMDFQVREPISPLFGGMKKTNLILEVQIAQEYTGQQRHVCYLIPMFKEILKFKTYCKEENDTVLDIVSGNTYGNKNAGMAAVTNTGNDDNWTGHDLAAANLYGYGRLSFNPDLTSEEIANEWITLTFGTKEHVIEYITKILMMSWPAYEKYTSPLGIGWMVNPSHHYGPNVDGYEYDRWGTYHKADHTAIGVDRTKNGTGYTTQYHRPNQELYETPETCPEELLLFFHRIPYTYQLKTGKTLIQHIYDSHFEGVEDVEEMVSLWEELKGKLEEVPYHRVLHRLQEQLEHSKEWRDVICSYFNRKTAIEDKKGRKIY